MILMFGFILGVGAGSFFDISQRAILILAIIATLFLTVFYRRGSRILNSKIAFAAVVALFFLAGLLRFEVLESQSKILTNFNDINADIKILGYVNDEPQRLIDKQRLVVQVKEARVPGYAVFMDEKVLITANLYPEFEYGDFILVEGKIQSPKKFDNDFDYAAYLAKDSIFSLSYYPRIVEISKAEFLREPMSKAESLKISLFRKIFAFKKDFEESIEKAVAEPNASLINGLLLGSRESIPQDLKDAFNKTGTTHILAISGYNITIIALYISALLLFFIRRQKAFWFAILAIALFVILTGSSPSVVRAAIMGSLVLLAYREGRFYSASNAVIFAGAVMIFLNPRILRFDLGFQLSFLATLGLIYIAPKVKEKLEKVPEFWTFKENFISTVSAQAAVLPLILYQFKSFSFVSLPANFLILPAVPLTMLAGFLTGVAGLIFPWLGQIFGAAAWLLSSYEILVIKFFNLFA